MSIIKVGETKIVVEDTTRVLFSYGIRDAPAGYPKVGEEIVVKGADNLPAGGYVVTGIERVTREGRPDHVLVTLASPYDWQECHRHAGDVEFKAAIPTTYRVKGSDLLKAL